MMTAPAPDGRAQLAQAVDRCCATEGSSPMTRDDAVLVARLLKAVADPVRLQILGIVRCSPGQEICACDLPTPLGLSQPTVSHHLKVLVEAGLLTRDRRGQWAWFALVPDRLALARRALEV
ncbi:metalloregulator ArsR/SmtB family transcription factor [uncultured Serinicoccus sp.]|uniref:ArsR/SmtB family transcription factor n=1 Tax=uncultured Serinicoccus sp. TaxID=735514 RepID=UPI0026025595|nr:metalloregulator ArsR/SmtB family transcription factor [uncultured Serinicoccus sp.]